MTDAPFIHHLALRAADFASSERMYTAALAALGLRALHRTQGVAEYWREEEDRLSFSLEREPDPTRATRHLHLAFAAADRAAVDRFHAAAVAAGGRSRHAPRFWPEYRAYCAFVADPDGNNVEAVHKEAGAAASAG